jgi:hypothetical protein
MNFLSEMFQLYPRISGKSLNNVIDLEVVGRLTECKHLVRVNVNWLSRSFENKCWNWDLIFSRRGRCLLFFLWHVTLWVITSFRRILSWINHTGNCQGYLLVVFKGLRTAELFIYIFLFLPTCVILSSYSLIYKCSSHCASRSIFLGIRFTSVAKKIIERV